MDENSDVALASPALVDLFGKSLYTERRFPSISRILIHFFRLHFLFTETMKARFFAGPFAQMEIDSKDADWIPGTAMIARRSAVEEVGTMSEEFPMYGEDVEWCWRFKDAGWRIGVVNRFTVTHLGGTSAARSFDTDEKLVRMERATFNVSVKMKGRLYATILTALESFIAGTETLHPGRSASERQLSAKRFRILLDILLSRS
jgi:GT2 family glycosyltransferase